MRDFRKRQSFVDNYVAQFGRGLARRRPPVCRVWRGPLANMLWNARICCVAIKSNLDLKAWPGSNLVAHRIPRRISARERS